MPELERSSRKLLLQKTQTELGGASTAKSMTQHESEKTSMIEHLRLLKLKKQGLLNDRRNQEEEFKRKFGDTGAGDETIR